LDQFDLLQNHVDILGVLCVVAVLVCVICWLFFRCKCVPDNCK